jgi:hypothetical protein
MPEDQNPESGTELLPSGMRLPEVLPPAKATSDFLPALSMIFQKLYPKPEFRRMLETVSNATSVHGSYQADRFEAARLTQAEALQSKVVIVATAKRTKIARGHETLLRRYDLGRKHRLALLSAPKAAE